MSKFDVLTDNEVEFCEYTMVLWGLGISARINQQFYALERALSRAESNTTRVERLGRTLEIDLNTDMFKCAQVGYEIAFECKSSDGESCNMRFKIKELVKGPTRNYVTLDHAETVPMPE